MTDASAASFASQLRTPKISASVERQMKQLRKMLATLGKCVDGKGYAVADDHSRMLRQPRWKRRNSRGIRQNQQQGRHQAQRSSTSC